ncbi:hypothetical protein ACFO0N_00240 [Halobium salinum]|uniref:ParB-like nuclease domain-containing protein n=1 Tax=Halobium salinum TaxID=1364940 RepID=A0ABD5P6M2_9EURY|nr:hypothetical protein [Halobium salinum]
MTLAERVREEGASVPEDEVVAHWLAEELEEEDDPDLEVGSLTAEERLAALLRRKPIAVATFDDRDLDWYRVDLREDELAATRVIKGDDDEGWREVAEDDRIESAARTVHDAETAAGVDYPEDPDAVAAEFEKDLETVLGVAEAVADGESMPGLVVVADEEPPFVVDGNHRAVGVVLASLRGAEWPGQSAYVGVEHRED